MSLLGYEDNYFLCNEDYSKEMDLEVNFPQHEAITNSRLQKKNNGKKNNLPLKSKTNGHDLKEVSQSSCSYSISEESKLSSSGRKMKRWTKEEDDKLLELIEVHKGKNWKKVSEQIPGRSPIQCLHRWTKILQPGLVKGPWTVEEDRKLIEWVKSNGAFNWSQCAETIKGRSGKQCRERWVNSLNPNVKKGNWTPEEDFKIFFLFEVFNGKWIKIVEFIQGRTENSIKNRFFSSLRRIYVEKKKLETGEAVKSSLAGGLDELKTMYPVAMKEVSFCLMKSKNWTRADLENYQKELLNKSTKIKSKQKLSFKVDKEVSNRLNNNTVDTTRPNVININLNINSSSNNNNIINIGQQAKNATNIDMYRNMNLFNLESEIYNMCDNSDLLFKEYNFFDFNPQVESLVDNVFQRNNIIVNNDPLAPCDFCKDPYSIVKPDLDSLTPNTDMLMGEIFSSKENKTNDEEERKKNDILNSLLSQLNDLENLVQKTKRELLKHEEQDKN